MFAFVTANPDALRGEGFRAGGAAAALYLAALAFLVAAGGWRGEEIADPELSDPIPPFRVFVEPPAERANPGAGGGTPKFSAVRRNPPRLVQPEQISTVISASNELAAAADIGEDPEIESRGPFGDPSGQPNGIGTTGPGTKGGPSGGEGPFPLGGDVKAPVLLYRVEPLYPEPARKLRQEGLVSLQAIITAEGTVEELRLIGSAFPLLDEAALAAVSRWRYRPGTLNDRPVRVILTVTVFFRLH